MPFWTDASYGRQNMKCQKVPNRVPFQGTKSDKVPYRVSFQWTTCDAVPKHSRKLAGLVVGGVVI